MDFKSRVCFHTKFNNSTIIRRWLYCNWQCVPLIRKLVPVSGTCVMQSGTSFCLVFYSALESGNHVIVIVTSDWSLLLFAFCSCCFYHSGVNYSKLFKLFQLFVIMNWKGDQIEKLILFYFHNSFFSGTRFLVPEILQLVPETGTRFWYQFLVSMSWALV